MEGMNSYLNSKYNLSLPDDELTISFNCLAFALNRPEWWVLEEFQGWDDITWDGCASDLDEEDFERYTLRREDDVANCIDELISFPCLYPEFFSNYVITKINSVNELKDGEYAIAMKLGYDDFHFARRFDDGKWYHKQGCREIEEMSEKVVFGRFWDNSYCETFYDTDTVLFSVKIA